MIDSIVSLLKSGTFWAALAVLIAGVPLVISGVRTFRRRSLQRYSNRERASHSAHSLDWDLARGYSASVDSGLRGLQHLPQIEREKAREKLKKLIDELKRTHETIVDALSLFSIGKAKTFFEKFDERRVEFEKLIDKGIIVPQARTHCTEIERIVSDLSSLISENSDGWQDINALRYSLENPEREVIVPMMVAILYRTELVQS